MRAAGSKGELIMAEMTSTETAAETRTCGFRSQGRLPGLHAKRCATHKATVAMEEPHD